MIYLFKNTRNTLIKIGFSDNPEVREKALKKECMEGGRDYGSSMIRVYKGTRKDEAFLHARFRSKRQWCEWFWLNEADIEAIDFLYADERPVIRTEILSSLNRMIEMLDQEELSSLKTSVLRLEATGLKLSESLALVQEEASQKDLLAMLGGGNATLLSNYHTLGKVALKHGGLAEEVAPEDARLALLTLASYAQQTGGKQVL